MSTRKPPTLPAKAKPGDHVAILSPSWAGPGLFPEVHERGLKVLREQFELIPVEYPTTRRLHATPEDRAADLMAAFTDPSITAVLASIGGSDQIRVLAHLDAEVFISNPTAFMGYSDNTNLLNWLWRLGIASYHGGSTLVHLARPGGAHPVFINSLRRALFSSETVEIAPLAQFSDLECDWAEPSTLDRPLPTSNDEGWYWHNASRLVTGATWGGNLEILHWNLAIDRWILPVEHYAGCVLLIETSEEMPRAEEVFRMLRNAGERGLLEQFPAVVVAKAKAWSADQPLDEAARSRFRLEQRDAVLRAFGDYNSEAMIVVGPDFGHTDPQYVVPYGGLMTVNGPARTINVTY